MRGARQSSPGKTVNAAGTDDLPFVDDARVLPVEPRGGGPGVGDPVERDVVEDRVSREAALGLSFKGACDLLVAVRVVVEHPGCKASG